MPDSTQLIAEWEKEKAVLGQKDFRGDAERMATPHNERQSANDTEYICKDALLEWAKETYLNENASAIRKICYKQLIDKIESL